MAAPTKTKTWPASAIEMRAIATLSAYPNNSRLHSPEQIDIIVRSITEFGWTTPILVDENGMLICGHARLAAAQKLGLREVPVMVARGWSEAQKRAYVISDNAIALQGTWDLPLLRAEIGDLKALDFDLPLLGFSDLEMVEFTTGLTNIGVDPDEAPEPPVVPVSRAGDLWLLGDHRLLCGDATSKADVERCLGRAKPNLMVVDPPYGTDYDPMWRNRVKRQDGSLVGAKSVGVVHNDDRDDWREAWSLFEGDVAYVWHGGLHASAVQESLAAANLMTRSQIVWAKHQFVIGRGDYHWQHECCWYAVRKGGKGWWAGDRKQSTIWSIAAPSGWAQITEGADAHSNHSTQKPIECMKRPIENNSKVGSHVYDPFVGSFTTGIACEMTRRKCLAIELDPAYVDCGVLRWSKFTGKPATLESTGQTFDDVAKQRAAHEAAPAEHEPVLAR